MHLISTVFIAVGQVFSLQYVQSQIEDSKAWGIEEPYSHIWGIVIHLFIASSVTFMVDLSDTTQRVLLVAHTLPPICRMSNFPPSTIGFSYSIASCVTGLLCVWYCLQVGPFVFNYIRQVYSNASVIVEAGGGMVAFSWLWSKLMVPHRFLCFWLWLFFVQLYTFYFHPDHDLVINEPWPVILLSAAASITSSPISLAATCYATSYISYLVLLLAQVCIMGTNWYYNTMPTHTGWTEAITLGVLALQTNLTDIRMPHRLAVFAFLMFIILATLLQSIHEVCEPLVLAAVSQVSTKNKHFIGMKQANF